MVLKIIIYTTIQSEWHYEAVRFKSCLYFAGDSELISHLLFDLHAASIMSDYWAMSNIRDE